MIPTILASYPRHSRILAVVFSDPTCRPQQLNPADQALRAYAHGKIALPSGRARLEALCVTQNASLRLTRAAIFANLAEILGLGCSAMLCLRQRNDVAKVAWINIRPAAMLAGWCSAKPALERLPSSMAEQECS
jgi:hypothetical protein